MATGDRSGAGKETQPHALEDYRQRFTVSIILTIPILLLSAPVQTLLGIVITFPGSDPLLLALATAVYIYGGWPYLTPAAGAILMSASTVIVAINAQMLQI